MDLQTFLFFIGLAGGVLGVLLYFPQIIKSYRTKHTKDLALGTYALILIIDILWSIYGVGINNPVLYCPNIISIFLSITILAQKRKYDNIIPNGLVHKKGGSLF